ncbi:putative secreted protein [Fusarium sporotrichioides]|uniref:Putative secreted protein n=1 Tax=Fusarium sporotrichioides TaxID=5514 RepID=A0A395RQ67_FUSSP|nr:putative secreted protein [Fusarium sporotrichioides]
MQLPRRTTGIGARLAHIFLVFSTKVLRTVLIKALHILGTAVLLYAITADDCESRCANGYLFVAPFTGHRDPADHSPAQLAPYILTDTSDLVLSGFYYFSTWAGNF